MEKNFLYFNLLISHHLFVSYFFHFHKLGREVHSILFGSSLSIIIPIFYIFAIVFNLQNSNFQSNCAGYLWFLSCSILYFYSLSFFQRIKVPAFCFLQFFSKQGYLCFFQMFLFFLRLKYFLNFGFDSLNFFSKF